MEITVKIQAPELASAIQTLATALGGKSNTISLGEEIPRAGMPITQNQTTAQQERPNQVQQGAPVQQPQAVPTAQYQASQVQQPAPQQPQTVPTSAPSYTMDQLAVAATQLMDAGRQQELLGLLSSFGAQSLMALPKEQYGAFATKLREMGAKI